MDIKRRKERNAAETQTFLYTGFVYSAILAPRCRVRGITATRRVLTYTPRSSPAYESQIAAVAARSRMLPAAVAGQAIFMPLMTE